MRWRTIRVILLTLFLTACTSSLGPADIIPGFKDTLKPHIVFHMDTAFTECERADADLAAKIWNAQTEGVAQISLVYDLDLDSPVVLQELRHKNIVIRYESDMNAVRAADENSKCDGCVLGWMTSGGVHNTKHTEVWGGFVADRMMEDNMRLQVMLHEFGHALGLPHVSSRQAIMYPNADASRTSCLKQPDLVAFCSVNDCGTHKMHPCE